MSCQWVSEVKCERESKWERNGVQCVIFEYETKVIKLAIKILLPNSCPTDWLCYHTCPNKWKYNWNSIQEEKRKHNSKRNLNFGKKSTKKLEKERRPQWENKIRGGLLTPSKDLWSLLAYFPLGEQGVSTQVICFVSCSI